MCRESLRPAAGGGGGAGARPTLATRPPRGRAAGIDRRRCRRAGCPGPAVWVRIRRALSAPTQAAGQADDRERQYLLGNAPAETPLVELIRICGMRWAIAGCFAEGKGARGLDHDERRSWPGWQHHLTLVILAHHFLVRCRRRLMDRGDPARSCPSASRTPASYSRRRCPPTSMCPAPWRCPPSTSGARRRPTSHTASAVSRT